MDKNKSLFCDNSPSKPLPNMDKVLVTGASGYVGGILVPEFIARGYNNNSWGHISPLDTMGILLMNLWKQEE
jgi:hypothetical protein